MNRATRISIADRVWADIQPDHQKTILWIALDNHLIAFTPDFSILEAAGFEVDWSIEDHSPFVEIPAHESHRLESLIANGYTVAIASRRLAATNPPLFTLPPQQLALPGD